MIEALNQGYGVCTTTRSHKRFDEVKQMLLNGGISQAQVDDVEFVEADLSNDEGWTEACRGCTYVLQVASPRLMEVPKNPDDMIKPATEGTLRVLKAAKQAGGVKRVVFTSSMGATCERHPSHLKLSVAELTTSKSTATPTEAAKPSPKPTGQISPLERSLLTQQAKPSPSAQHGTTSPKKAAAWNSLSSTPTPSSVPC